MHHTAGCRREGAPATTLVSSWLAHVRGDRGTNADPLPPPGVNAVMEALSRPWPAPSCVAEALVMFAWERASGGSDLTCTIDEVDALWDVLEAEGVGTVGRHQARHWVTDAWVDAVASQRGAPGIEPLSGLHTVSYLFGRIQELDRLADSTTAHLVLVMIRWHEPKDPWTRISCILQVASALRSHVRTEATLSQFGTHCAFALIPDDGRARLERGVLLKTLETGELGTMGVSVEIVPLPEDRSLVTELIVRLRDGSLVGDQFGPIGWFQPDGYSLD